MLHSLNIIQHILRAKTSIMEANRILDSYRKSAENPGKYCPGYNADKLVSVTQSRGIKSFYQAPRKKTL